MITEDQVTIIIPHLGRTKEQKYSLKECITSLDETCSCKRVIVLNGLPFESDIELYVPKNENIMTLSEQGQCRAVNAAIATISTPYILVTNDDMIFPMGWFERLVNSISEDEIICISPQLVEPQKGAPTFIHYFCGGAGGDFDKNKFSNFVDLACQKEEIRPTLSGFNLPFLISKELWDTIGGYDINYDPWSSNSDSDLEYKIKLSGIQPQQNTNCLVYHFSQTSGTFEPQNRPAWEKNWQYFIDKWGFPRTDNGIWEATFNIPIVAEGRIFEPWWEDLYKEEEDKSMKVDRSLI